MVMESARSSVISSTARSLAFFLGGYHASTGTGTVEVGGGGWARVAGGRRQRVSEALSSNGRSTFVHLLVSSSSSSSMASLLLSSSSAPARVGMPATPLALRQNRPVMVAITRLPGGQLHRAGVAGAGAASTWERRPLRPDLAGGGRATLLRPRALLASSQIASCAFTWGTIAVLPFYTLMVVAPNADVTKRAVDSTVPYVALGLLYGYLLYLSWTPDTLRAMFASKYWLPELPGIVRMFASEMTVASAWIHLLAVDLFAARQVYHDGIKNNIETRHSVSLCLLFCPIGIATHAVTKTGDGFL
uniref:Uncharacterized protein n=1 Tax=Leersia perrieri TaxID=77586 RepID=A0A0D9UWD3_9ORYZ